MIHQGQFAEIIAFVIRSDDAFAIDNALHGTFENDVLRFTLIALIEHTLSTNGMTRVRRKKNRTLTNFAFEWMSFEDQHWG